MCGFIELTKDGKTEWKPKPPCFVPITGRVHFFPFVCPGCSVDLECPAKSIREIYRAHDILEAIILKEVPNPFAGAPHEQESIDQLEKAILVLCWALNHETKVPFDESLARIEKWLADAGFTLQHYGAHPIKRN